MSERSTETALTAALAARIDTTVHSERARLRRRLAGIVRRHAAGRRVDRALAALDGELVTLEARLAERRARLPVPTFDESLPVNQHREDIARAIAANPVVVICGETGSGKTTQIPKICLQLGYGVRGLIGHTQPRRIAARSVAARIAEELGTAPGQVVGYKVRFSDHTGPQAAIKLMTDGILLAETQGDPDLEQYEVVIVDEAHERSLNIDFLLGYLHRLRHRRPDLKLIITSATIDPRRFSRHFDDAPVLEVSGRTYPVEIRYRPLTAESEDERDRDLQQAILDAVDEVWAQGPGDILIFLAGEREIRETAESLRKHHPPGVEILPLFARLSAQEQNRVFRAAGRPRIVLATNVAETSLTVPGIRYVIDPGTARISRYSHRARIQRLPVEPVSQASANQRAGRCGRVMAGMCVRLYGEEDYLARPQYTDPEILRTNLAAVILQMAALGLGPVEDFPFLDPPDRRLVSDGFRLLHELGAVDAERGITRLGRSLARLPIDPRLGRMVLAAGGEGCVRDILVIVAGLAIQDPRERPLDARPAADQRHRRFHDPRSDFLALLRLWDWYQHHSRHLSRSKLRALCQESFLSYVRMREWQELVTQISEVAVGLGLTLDDRRPAPLPGDESEDARAWPANHAALHQALLTGLLGQLGLRQEDGRFLGSRGRRFHLFPGSGLFRKPPRWVMSAELVETTRLYGRTNAAVDPAWIEPLAGHLVRRDFTEPHWERRPAQVAAFETVTLHGLPIVVRRKVNFGPIDPVLSRELFIREGLVAGEYPHGAPFLRHNLALTAEVEELEIRARRRDISVDPEEVFRFYDARIPKGICSGAAFERWRREAERADARLLYLEREVLLPREDAARVRDGYPDCLRVAGMDLPLGYVYDPTREDDGVTVTVPLAALNLLDVRHLEWLVPGLLGERVAALLKTLPKNVRRQLVPVPETAAALVRWLDGHGQDAGDDLLHVLSAGIAALRGVQVPIQMWNPDALPGHLRFNIRVVDAAGATVAEGRDLEALQQRLRARARAAFGEAARAGTGTDPGRARRVPRAGAPEPAAAGPATPEVARDWVFGDLPAELAFERAGVILRGYPALVPDDAGAGVRRELFDDTARAAAAHRRGLRHLIALRHRNRVRDLRRNLPDIQSMALRFINVGTQQALVDDLVDAAIDRAYLDAELPRTRAAFEAVLAHGAGRLGSEANRLCAVAAQVLQAHQSVVRRLGGTSPASAQEVAGDVRSQLDGLVYPGFVTATPDPWLERLPRYLQALELRLEKLGRAPERDRQRRSEVERLWRRCLDMQAKHRRREWFDPALTEFRWLMEEFRVQQFAQELRTAVPVSARRLEECWARVRNQ